VDLLVEKEQLIQELREEIEEIKASLPAHTIKAATLQRLEELEDQLHELEGEGQDA
jgi:uncharacterized protein involved in exopolysaccharide biosynthesis